MTEPQQPPYTDDICDWCRQRYPMQAKERYYTVVVFDEVHTICGDCFDHLKPNYLEIPEGSRPAPSPDDMAFKDSIIEQQQIHIRVLNEKMVEMMQGAAAQAREDVLTEPRDCATCSNKHNAKKYVNAMIACTHKVSRKREMDNHKSGCPECRSMGVFTLSETKCRGYSGKCEQSSCRNFRWWGAKCYCPMIREYDNLKESLRSKGGN